MSRRQVRVTKEHNDECKRLLTLMGIPVVTAPGEAEAQCAELARAGKVYAAGSEDMDTLTFNTPILLRHLTFSEAKKMAISEIKLDEALRGLEMTMDQVSYCLPKADKQFIELCILLGCDYLEPVKGVGPKTALKLIREHGSLAEVVKFIRGKMAEKAAENAAVVEESESEPESEEGGDNMIVNSDGEEVPVSPKKKTPKKKKAKKSSAGMQIPEYWPWEEAKQLFIHPDVVKGDELEVEWKTPDVEGLVEFLVREKGFKYVRQVAQLTSREDRVRAGAAKLSKMLAAKQQGRLDGFFSVKPKADDGKGKAKGKDAGKRKGDDKAKPGAKKRK